jgi:replicative DNA helicase
MVLDKITKGRTSTERLVVSCLMKDLSLFADVNLKEDDFKDKKSAFYYSIANKMSNGYKVFDEVSISNFLEKHHLLMEKYEEFGGYESVRKAKENVSLENFNKYYDDLAKANLLYKYYKLGIDPTIEIEYKGNKLVPINIFKEMSSNEVYDFYQMILSDISLNVVGEDVKIEQLYYTEDDINDIKSGETLGTDFRNILEWVDEHGNKKFIQGARILNAALTGLNAENGVHFVAGFSGSGKTTFSLVSYALALVTNGSKVLIVSNEQTSKYYKTILLSFICREVYNCRTIDRNKIKKWEFSEEELKIVNKANKFLSDYILNKLCFIRVDKPDVNKVIKMAKQLCLAEGYDALIYETMKVDDPTSGTVTGELVRDSRILDDFGTAMNMKIICPIQLLTNSEGTVSFLTSRLISNSKQIKEVANSIVLMRKVLPEELDEKDKMYMKPYKLVKNKLTNKWTKEYIKDLDPLNKKYRYLQLDKNREGDDSLSLLYEFDNKSGYLKEIGQLESVYKGQLSY